MKEIMTDVVMLIVIATAIILGAWGLKSFMRNRTEQELRQIIGGE